MSGQGWQPIATLREVTKRPGHNEIVVAKFVHLRDEEGDQTDVLEMSWAHVAYPAVGVWQVGTGGFRGVHGFASFPLLEATHWMPLPEAPAA
jgi:hypothetical protein